MTQTERDTYERAFAVYNAGDLLVKEILTSNFANIDQPNNAHYFNQLGDHQNLRPVKTDTGGFAYWNHSLTHTWARPNQDYSAAIDAAHNTYKIDWDYLRMLNSSGCDYSEDHIRYIEKPFLYAGGRQRNQATYTYTPRGQPKGSKHRGTAYCKKTSFTLIGPPGSKMKTFYQGGNSNSILIALDINCSKSVRAGKEPLAFTGNAFTNMRWWLDNQKRHLTKDVLEKVTSIKELKKTNQEIARNGTSPQHNEVLVKTRKDGVIAIIAPPRTLRARLTFPQNDRPQRLASVRAMQHLSRITGLKSLPILLRTRAGKMMPYPRLAQQADLKFAFSISSDVRDIYIYNSWLETLSEFEQTWVSSYNFGEGTMSPLNVLIEKIKKDDLSKNVICPIDLKKLKQYLTIEPLPPGALVSLPLAVLSQCFPFETAQLTLINAVHYDNNKLADLLIQQGADLNLQDQDGDTALILAVQKNNQEMVKELFQAKANLNLQDRHGDTALILAVRNNNPEMVRDLIRARADLNLQNQWGHTALILAVRNNNPEMVRDLIRARADLNLQDQHGDTALMWAVQKNAQKTVRELIKANANFNLQDKGGNTALMWAAFKGNLPLTALLMENQASLTLVNTNNRNVLTQTYQRYLTVNAQRKPLYREIIKTLITAAPQLATSLTKECVIEAIKLSDTKLAKLLIQCKTISLDIQDRSGSTALILAVRNNNPEMVRDLIRARADLDLQDQDGNTALILAVKKNNQEMVKELIQAKANLNLQDQHEDTALILAVRNNNPEMVRDLIRARADLDLQDQDGDTALILAVKKNNQEMVKELVKARADLDLQDQDGDTALMWAAFKGNLPLTELLMRNRASWTPVNTDSRNVLTETYQKYLRVAAQRKPQYRRIIEILITAVPQLATSLSKECIIEAIKLSDTKLAKLLIQCIRIPLDTQAQHGDTALILAIKKNDQETVRELIKARADLNLQDQDGNTALIWAILSLDVKMIKLLLDKKGPQGKNYQGKTALEQICQHYTTISPKTWTIITLVLQHAHTIIDPNDLSIAKNLKDLKIIIDTTADNTTLGAAITGALQQNDIPHWQKAYLTSCQKALDPNQNAEDCMLTGFWQESLASWFGYIVLGILTFGVGFILWSKRYSTKVSRNSSFGQKALLVSLPTATNSQATAQPEAKQSEVAKGEAKTSIAAKPQVKEQPTATPNHTATPTHTATPNHTKISRNSSFGQKALLVSLPTATNSQATAQPEAKQSEVAKGEAKTSIAAKPQAKEKSKATPKLTTQVKTSKLMEPVQTPTSSSQLKSALRPSPTAQGFSGNRLEKRLFTLMDCSTTLVIF